MTHMALARFKAPDTILVVFSIIILAAVATWFIPPGQYEKDVVFVEGVGDREVVVDGSFASRGSSVIRKVFRSIAFWPRIGNEPTLRRAAESAAAAPRVS
jgi:uncharacterized ion transporter superfamily protein YfcC